MSIMKKNSKVSLDIQNSFRPTTTGKGVFNQMGKSNVSGKSRGRLFLVTIIKRQKIDKFIVFQ